MVVTIAAPDSPAPSRPHPIQHRGRRMNAFSLACLHALAPCDSALRWLEQIEALVSHHGEAAVSAKLRDLRKHGYSTDGLPHVGYLTEKGRLALRRAAYQK